MKNYDYEIRGYCVEWKIGEKLYKEDGFTEESATKFAREKLKTADEVALIQESYAIGWPIDISEIIQKIESLYNNFGNNSHSFTVDYDQETDGIYCNYVPYPNDDGFAVSGDLLIMDETSQTDLKKLKDWLDEKGIHSRSGCEWDWDY